jgi:hypothetical protein
MNSRPLEMIILWVAILLNFFVWLFPGTYYSLVGFMRNEHLEGNLPILRQLRELLNHPNYIWFLRFAAGIILFTLFYAMFFLGKT